MSVIFKCIYGPELFRIYRMANRVSARGDAYVGNALERYSSTLMNSVRLSFYVSPFSRI